MTDEEQRKEIRAEAERVLEVATLSSETQFEYAKTWRSVDRWIGSAAAALARCPVWRSGQSLLPSRGWRNRGGGGAGRCHRCDTRCPQTTEKAGAAASALRASSRTRGCS